MPNTISLHCSELRNGGFKRAAAREREVGRAAVRDRFADDKNKKN